jgi:hypothetical protein
LRPCLGLGWTAFFLLLLVSCAQSQVPAPNPQLAPADPAEPGSIQGTVAGKDGEAYEGVRVELVVAGEQPPLTTETDGSGEFSFVNLPAGAFTLTVASQGFVTQTRSGVLNPGESYDARTVVLPLMETTSNILVSAAQQEQIAEQQIHIEEQQRVLGVLPNYYVSYAKSPVPLNTRQKFALAWKSSVDPYTWLLNGITAGVQQADNGLAGYGQGMQGYGKRLGADAADTFVSNEIGGAILPSLFRQDPRYFYKGTGTIRARAAYAIATTVICKGDNMRWQFNLSGILGGLAAGGVSNLYYPATSRSGVALTFENAGVGLAEAAVQNLIQEFVVKKLTPSARRAASE